MSDRFSSSKYLMVLAHDSTQKATTDLVDALIKDDQGSIGARLIDAEKRLTLALTDIAKAFAALDRK